MRWRMRLEQRIISSDSILDIGEIYSKVVREKKHLNSIREHETQQNDVGFVAKKEFGSTRGDQTTSHTYSGRRDHVARCNHCGRSGQEKANCWQLATSWNGGKSDQTEEIEVDMEEVASRLTRTETVEHMLKPLHQIPHRYQNSHMNNGEHCHKWRSSPSSELHHLQQNPRIREKAFRLRLTVREPGFLRVRNRFRPKKIPGKWVLWNDVLS